MTTPRLVVDLAAVTHNARVLVGLLTGSGIGVTGVVKAVLGSPPVACAMLAGGVTGLGDSRVENLETLASAAVVAPRTLVRTPALSQVPRVVRASGTSLNTEAVVLVALSEAAAVRRRVHGVVLMVELGDLREGLAVDDVVAAARVVAALPGLRLRGVGTNLACRSGVAPDQRKMDELSRVAARVESALGVTLAVVSGGNSANLVWALGGGDAGRVNDLRLGEALLLGVEPLQRTVLPGLRTDAFRLVAEVVEAQRKPARPWGRTAQSAFGGTDHGTVLTRPGAAEVNQVVVALGRQDTDPGGLTPPPGITVLAMSSDHLVLDVGDHSVSVGDEVTFGLGYGALLRAATSPYVATVHVGAEPVTGVEPATSSLQERRSTN